MAKARPQTKGALERELAWRDLKPDEFKVVWLYHLIEWGRGSERRRSAELRLPTAIAAIGEARAAELLRWFVGQNPRRRPPAAEEVQP